MRLLKRVDTQRRGAHVQALYSQRDDMRWFASVTDQLYRAAVVSEVERVCEGVCEPAVAEAALQQVYGARWSAEAAGDAELQAVLGTLVHVRYDRAFECPVAEGALIPQRLRLYALSGRDVNGNVLSGGGVNSNVLSGSDDVNSSDGCATCSADEGQGRDDKDRAVSIGGLQMAGGTASQLLDEIVHAHTKSLPTVLVCGSWS